MARGKKTPASFVKGDPRAAAAGRKSSRALTPEIREARMTTSIALEERLHKYMSTPIHELKEILKEASTNKECITPSVDLIVIKIITKAIENGDYQRLNFLLERTIGKVSDKLEVNSKQEILTLHDIIIRKLEGTGQQSIT